MIEMLFRFHFLVLPFLGAKLIIITMFTPISASGKFVGELIFRLEQMQTRGPEGPEALT